MSWLETALFYSEVTYQRVAPSECAWNANFWSTFWWKVIINHDREIYRLLIELKSKLFMPGCFWGRKWAGHGKLVSFELAQHWPNEFLTWGWTFLLKHTHLQTHLWMWQVERLKCSLKCCSGCRSAFEAVLRAWFPLTALSVALICLWIMRLCWSTSSMTEREGSGRSRGWKE